MDKDALTAWEEEMARGEEDNSMLTRYTAEDEGKAKVHNEKNDLVKNGTIMQAKLPVLTLLLYPGLRIEAPKSQIGC